MRMRKRQNLAPRMEACRSVWLEDAAYLRGNWRSLMPQARELRLEIGCGKGKFTVETAALEPDVLFVAVERVQEALVLAMEKALSMGLKNVYFLSIDAAKLEEYFAPGEVDLIYLNFCDPWPRKKNAKRRLTFHTFLKSYQRVLRLNGEIHFKTDNAPLFEWSLGEFEACGLEIRNLTRNLHENGPVGIMTGYEEKFYALGTPIMEEALISRLTLRSMKQAKYSTVNTGHFGLATSYYCHFTSPIRRYPDLQIHRIIKDNLRGRMNAKRIEHYEKILPEVAKHSSEMERRADEAERECDKLKKVQYMSGHLGEEFWGVISGVTEWGFYVELPNTVEGLVHVTTLTDDYFHYSESTYELIGETTAKRYKLGQKVKIVVAATDPFMRTIDFRVVTGTEDEENEKLNQKFIAE